MLTLNNHNIFKSSYKEITYTVLSHYKNSKRITSLLRDLMNLSSTCQQSQTE